YIIQESVKYAGQKNDHSFSLESTDLKIFVSILLFSGYHTLPRQKSYRSTDEDLAVPCIAGAMSRNRFEEIKRYLHLNDNSLASTSKDKLFKIRPLFDLFNSSFLPFGMLHQDLSIDESMVKYFGRHS